MTVSFSLPFAGDVVDFVGFAPACYAMATACAPVATRHCRVCRVHGCVMVVRHWICMVKPASHALRNDDSKVLFLNKYYSIHYSMHFHESKFSGSNHIYLQRFQAKNNTMLIVSLARAHFLIITCGNSCYRNSLTSVCGISRPQDQVKSSVCTTQAFDSLYRRKDQVQRDYQC